MTIKVYCCRNCGSENVKQHVLISATGMMSVNGPEKPTFPPLIDYSVKQRGFLECWDCGIRWNKLDEGDWIEKEEDNNEKAKKTKK